MTPPTPSNPSLRFHIADVLRESPKRLGSVTEWPMLADALLADPTLRAIIDLAARHLDYVDAAGTPEVRALLANWRAER